MYTLLRLPRFNSVIACRRLPRIERRQRPLAYYPVPLLLVASRQRR